MPFPRPETTGPHPVLISSCPACLRRSVCCPQCGRQSGDDNDGHLPLWCRECGADLRSRNGDGKQSLEERIRPFFPGESSPARRYPLILVGLAVVCGLVASYMTSATLRRDPEPIPRIVRGTYSIRPPHRGWGFDVERWCSEQADLVLESKYRGGQGAFFLVHVVRPSREELSLDEMARQIEKQWPSQIDGCQLLSRPQPTTVAGRPALRLVAVGRPYEETTPDHDAGDRRRREAVVLVWEGVGYRLTCDANERRFESARAEFEQLMASLVLIDGDAERVEPNRLNR